jgi:endonuclease/exonuclease/phosphatase (EEP) superfamily protein YafD
VLRIAVILGLALQLTLRDAIPGFAVAYYALPRSILAVLAFSIAFAGMLLGRRRQAVVWLAAAIGITCWWCAADWRARTPSGERGVRVLYWNVCRGYGGWEAVMRQIAAERPDLVALGETAQPSDEMRSMWRQRFPDYDVSFLGGGMMCLVRGTSSDSRVQRIDDYTHVREIDATIDGTDFRCLIVDVYAHPLYDRRTALTAIAQLAERSAVRPLLVLGDFNTPVDSVHFAELRRSHVNAFEQSGSGYAATWPAFAPVLSLDQIWANAEVEVLDCSHLRTRASDHRPVLVQVRAAAGNAAVREP